jgi:endonuclease YncB( thermonuclease family)
VECIVAFIGIVGLLAYIHVTAVAYQSVGAVQISPMMIEAGWIRADAGNSALRFCRKAALADARV